MAKGESRTAQKTEALRHTKLTLGCKNTEPITDKGRGVAREYYGVRQYDGHVYTVCICMYFCVGLHITYVHVQFVDALMMWVFLSTNLMYKTMDQVSIKFGIANCITTV
jgi:hypothetical protein